jgi:tetratricopeptide (TPR) repeat protein
MTRNLHLPGVLICLIAGSVAGRSQDRSLEEANHHAMALLQQGQYKEAKTVLSAALREAEKLPPGDDRLPTTLNNLASVYQDLGMIAEAERCYQRAIRLMGEIHGGDDPSLTRPLQNLWSLYLDQAQYAKAEQLQHRLLALRMGPGGPDPMDSIRTLHVLAAALHARHRNVDAERFYREVLSMGEKVQTDEAREATSAILNNLGLLCMQTGRLSEALGHLQQAVGILEKVFGKSHPGLVRMLVNLAGIYSMLRRPLEAEPLLTRALAIAETELGAQGQTYGAALAQYAVVLRQMNRRSEAKQYERRAREILATAASRTAAGQTVDVSDLIKQPARR